MGQRSQIYVRANGKLIIANYYQWNYAERMISRARWGIEGLKYYANAGYEWAFEDRQYIKKMSRIFDVNFDMRDVAISANIVKEWKEEFSEEDFNEFVFNNQDNDDGQLFVDIKGNAIYYCFRNMYTNEIMDARQYLDWDEEDFEKSKYVSCEAKIACAENIKQINEMAQLMTKEQLDDFLKGDYHENLS